MKILSFSPLPRHDDYWLGLHKKLEIMTTVYFLLHNCCKRAGILLHYKGMLKSYFCLAFAGMHLFWECVLLGFVVGLKFQLYIIVHYLLLDRGFINTYSKNILYTKVIFDWQRTLITQNGLR